MQRRDFFQRAVAAVGTVAGTVAGAAVATSAVSRSTLFPYTTLFRSRKSVV